MTRRAVSLLSDYAASEQKKTRIWKLTAVWTKQKYFPRPVVHHSDLLFPSASSIRKISIDLLINLFIHLSINPRWARAEQALLTSSLCCMLKSFTLKRCSHIFAVRSFGSYVINWISNICFVPIDPTKVQKSNHIKIPEKPTVHPPNPAIRPTHRPDLQSEDRGTHFKKCIVWGKHKRK